MSVQGILLDIEGTTSSISFVHDCMFPFARKALPQFLEQNWGRDNLAKTLDLLAIDIGQPDAKQWLSSQNPGAEGIGEVSDKQKQKVIAAVNQLMDDDKKVTGLKKLQGQVWKQGFDSGDLVAHIWPDVPGALQKWKDLGIDLRIYSSGSVAAQKMFFGHSQFGNLLSYFSGHYDNEIGGKKETSSYRAIAEHWGIPAESILFISDIVEELQAAKEAGSQACLSLREGNASVPTDHGFAKSSDFEQLEFLA